MDWYLLLLAFAFIVGIFAYAYPSIKAKLVSKQMLWSVLFPLGLAGLSYCSSKHGPVTIESFTFAFSFYFAFALYIFFKSDLLPNINEEIIIINTLLFWYLMLQEWQIWKYLHETLILVIFVLFLIMTFFVVRSVFVEKAPHPAYKVISYLWNMVILLCFLITQIPWKQVLFEYKIPGTPYDAFISGLFLMYFLSHLLPIIEFLPGKRERHYTERIRQHVELLKSKYTEDQTNVFRTSLICVFVGVVLIANYFLKVVQIGSLLCMLSAFVPIVIQYVISKKIIVEDIEN
jgi:hypothetical protein